MDSNADQLIALVEQYKCLYDNKHPHFKNANKKDEIWEAIGREIGTSSEVCLRRFRNLRDKFSRELKLHITSAESGGTYYSKWPYFSQMQFLRGHMLQRNKRSVFKNSTGEDDEDLNENKLLLLIEQCKCLYDKRHHHFKDTTKKELIWKAIGKQLGTSGKTCLIRYRKLREKFSRELRLQSTASANGTLYNTSWPLFDQMQFLREHMVQRKQRHNFNNTNVINETLDDTSLGLTISSIFQSECSEVPEDFDFITSSSHANKKIKLDEFKNDTVSEFSEKDDVVRGFCTMVQGSLLAMDRKKKMRTIKKLTDVLFDAENEE